MDEFHHIVEEKNPQSVSTSNIGTSKKHGPKVQYFFQQIQKVKLKLYDQVLVEKDFNFCNFDYTVYKKKSLFHYTL